MTILETVGWEKAIANAPHYRALGATQVMVNEFDAPYHLVTRAAPGGTFRYTTNLNYYFYADQPALGITLYWWFDLEKRGEDFVNHGINMDGILAVCGKLTDPDVRIGFKYWLAEVAEGLQKHANENRAIVERLDAEAKVLRLPSMGTGLVFEREYDAAGVG